MKTYSWYPFFQTMTTPLHEATLVDKNSGVIRALLENGAVVDPQDRVRISNTFLLNQKNSS